MKGRCLVSSLKCNNERHRKYHSSGVLAAREKRIAVPKPITRMRSPVDGMAFMLHNLTAPQSKTYLRRASDSSGGGLKMKEIEDGRHSLPQRGHQAAEWRRF